MELLLAVGVGVGLASVAGVRAFLPLALAALFTVLGLFANFEFVSTYLGVGEWTMTAVLGALALVEIVLDKIRALERGFNYIMIPTRTVSGALLFLAALGPLVETGPVPWLVAGALIAGIIAFLKVFLRPPAKVEASGVSARFLSGAEDVMALVGGAVGVLIPFVPLLLVGFLLFFYFRVRKRRGRKYGGLRILGD